MEPWIAWILLGLSVVGNILQSLVKLRWSKEFASAKDETIRAKEAEIDGLKSHVKALESLTPPKLREILDATIAIYERNIKQLEESRDHANAEVKELETTSAKLKNAQEIQNRFETLLFYAAQQRDLTQRRLEDEKRLLAEALHKVSVAMPDHLADQFGQAAGMGE